MSGPLRALALGVAALTACRAQARRVALVEPGDVESALVAEACVEVTQTLGEAGAHDLLDGHIVRAGRRTVFVWRERWPKGEEPSRRLTLVFEPADDFETPLPSPSVTLRADRARADGRSVRALAIDSGRFRLRTSAAEGARVELEVRFADPSEPPIEFSSWVVVRDLDALTPWEGRANPVARPEQYLGVR